MYRGATSTGTYYALGSKINTTATSGTLTVDAPSAVGVSYYYKVLTYGTVSGFNSERSTAYARLLTNITAATPPTTLLPTSSVIEGNIALSWSGATAGVNNAITGYVVEWQKSTDNATWGAATAENVADATYSIPSASLSRGDYIRYRVKAVGTVEGYDRAC